MCGHPQKCEIKSNFEYTLEIRKVLSILFTDFKFAWASTNTASKHTQQLYPPFFSDLNIISTDENEAREITLHVSEEKTELSAVLLGKIFIKKTKFPKDFHNFSKIFWQIVCNKMLLLKKQEMSFSQRILVQFTENPPPPIPHLPFFHRDLAIECQVSGEETFKNGVIF